MKRTIACLILVSIAISACHKGHDTVTPQSSTTKPVTNGDLSGVVSPAVAVQAVSVVSTSGTNSKIIIPDAGTGAINVSGLTAGNYIIHFTVNAGYKVPADSTVTITAGKTTALGTLTFTPTPVYSISSYKANGTVQNTYSARINYTSPNLSITVYGIIAYNSGFDYTDAFCPLNINLNAVTGPGTYVCKETPASSITYQINPQAGQGPGRGWSSINDGGSATVIITDIDPATRTISGTFTAILVPATAYAQGNQVITDGTFKLTYQ
ncbi:hypothetical protein [Mucilaginibacter arboris]|uniref:Carboxypeptidase regulatory-like domain-containing protein n=1 Tax=Mucilaginibacter arboris TaxID=2682090 RepID=A0A7K1SWB3_9SPHI|nr:hypothetical protein [Mucilaginibacter arboris]MVN21606.1 hypothetical protein [Mucilaginibacter arboris]